MSNQVTASTPVARLLTAMNGTGFVNAKRVINTKYKNHKPNPENLTLAERILLNRRKEQQQQRRDSPAGSVDISELTNQNDERKTPTPEPTLAETARKSPVITFTSSHEMPCDSPRASPRDTSRGPSCSLDGPGPLFTPVHRPSDHILVVRPVTSKLEPAYKEPPFPFLQSSRYFTTDDVVRSPSPDTRSRPNSSLGYNDNKSVPEVEWAMRRPTSSHEKRSARKRQRVKNPNDLSLAQKLLLYKNVMAYKESKD